MKYLIGIFSFTFLLFGLNPKGLTQGKGSGDKSAAAPKTEVLNFEDELVEGQNAKPELFYLLQQKNFNYKRLIRLRENFIPETKRSFENLQLNRGGN
jgi:hypothetical protein